ncbi:unnamed protein product [Pseudo-nitzschia multistriata]|uniref:Uncharacterized protein n=1 Tax=Pseudo-nitzschia multistriata TaxID=183589 RepID=A0A448Z0G5_9STRA|nr:unnamed protein product [Pseudo-nitzschia multistriata]
MVVKFFRVLDLLPIAFLFSRSDKSSFLGPLHGSWLGNLEECNTSVHVAVAVATDSSCNSVNEFAVSINHFHLFQSHVFTRLEFDKILLAINNSDATIFHELTDISSGKPPIDVDFIGLLGHHVIASCDIFTFDHDFTTSPDLISVHILSIGFQICYTSLVTNIRGRVQSNLNAGNGSSSDSGTHIIDMLDSQSSTGFGQTITLHQWKSKSDINESLDITVKGTTSRKRVLDITADEFLELLEDQHVEQGSVQANCDGKRPPHQCGVNECLCNWRRQCDLGNNSFLDSVPDLRHGYHMGGSKSLKGTCGVSTGGSQ